MLFDDVKRALTFREVRNRRALRRVIIVAVLAAPVLSIGAILLVLAAVFPQQNAQTEDLARQVAPEVARQVVTDSRAQSADAARDQLGRANQRLIAKDLPIVIPPPEDALSAVVQVQASRALVLADLAESEPLANALRNRYRGQDTFPASRQNDQDEPAPPDDIVVEILPADPPPAAPRTTGAGPPAQRSDPPPQRGPAPAPAPTAPAPRRDPGLLQPCLLNRVLC